MHESEIRKEIIEAAGRLVLERLVARSWGNISARLSDTEFIITPSGRSYAGMKESDLTKVRISDLSYDEGYELKPSSEKGVHAAVYSLMSDASFIIHTHQNFASAVCACGLDAVLPGGVVLPCAKYADPGSDALCDNLKAKMREYPASKAFLLSNHGTVFFGKDSREAFELALKTERFCEALFKACVSDAALNEAKLKYTADSKAGRPVLLMPCFLDDYAQIMPPLPGEDPDAVRMVSEKNLLAMLYAAAAGPAGLKPLSPEHCRAEHDNYVNSYSKLWNA